MISAPAAALRHSKACGIAALSAHQVARNRDRDLAGSANPFLSPDLRHLLVTKHLTPAPFPKFHLGLDLSPVDFDVAMERAEFKPKYSVRAEAPPTTILQIRRNVLVLPLEHASTSKRRFDEV